MTIEEKAKAYDEAIKKAKSKIKNDKDHVLYEDDVIKIFPELAESEDEKIRKELLQYLKECNNLPNGRYCRADFFVWLEKQGEKDEEILILKDQIESLHAAIKAIKETHRIELEKQGEQNSEWSEEDDLNIKRLIRLIEKDEAVVINGVTKDGWTTWLKSIKYRVLPQLKKEWSEEDAERFSSCLKRLGTGNPDQPETINSKWFREHVNLQKQWKPTLQQINALSIAVKNGQTDDINALEELLEQLKAL